MKKLFWIILGIILLGYSFLLPQKAQAEEISPQLVINEVMANPQGADIGKEWIELLCLSDIDLKDWKIKIFNDPDSVSPTKTITLVSELMKNGDYLIISNNTSVAVTNAKGKIVLSDPSGDYENTISWTTDMGDGYSMEVIGPPNELDYKKWLKSIELGGTPGIENSVTKIEPVIAPEYVLPLDNQTFLPTQTIDFSWVEEEGIKYVCQISSDESFSILIDASELEIGKYFWRVKAENSLNYVYTIPRSFEIIEPVYSKEISISEILPNPTGDDTIGEWIELFNKSGLDVDLSGWRIVDGSGKFFLIPKSTIIKAYEFISFPRTESDLTLNNDGDEVKLYQPNNNLISSIIYTDNGDEGLSWVIGPDGAWSWTTTPTKGSDNIITVILEIEEVQEIEPIINTTPIEMATGDFENYLDKLVKITGKVVSTSGDTFYLDDGSGLVKVYIQKKTGINKPEMNKGDIFEIVGVVDLYGQTWRVLPRSQNDILLVEHAAKIVSTKKAVKKVATETVKAINSPPVSKAVAAASNTVSENKKEEIKNLSLGQAIKTIIGLSIILFVFFIITIRKLSKQKTGRQIGGHFGDDET
ncbi:TPA: hypothetical protein DD449_01880 [Candidatus Berkelbacteria bacterium]|uniref:Nucleic acid binding OB-fold tRNA/helicase-type n=1 Tax=Berkelbacteria bacterium GW2011_GWE1_39_12 TaxID=1618337 RepID=A0A0G4B663_9BACT|nr:MAG: nucleic acid binding OB-fold tRNA/helicase-type [Berkelbacteria bacterium GW2011_GWE1_39_12]HBO60407.1 hypothetical protein [Candidatus Berkelbacteria bacterium]